MNENKHYYAFISHSNKDEKIALWLRDQLVSYNIPTSVQKEYNTPKRLRPVFVYQTDLAGNVLDRALGKELQDSQYLIVICSPAGAKSKYVNGEVQHFIDAGRTDRIIPFIVDGVPHAKNPNEECFTPAMLNAPVELRGADFNALTKELGSKKGAVVNIIATMLGVRFDVLWDIYKRKQRKKHLAFACLAVLMAGLALFVWDYKRSSYKYFVDYVDRWGVPEGVFEINKEQFSHKSNSYLFEYKRTPFGTPNAYSWRVVKVSYVNSVIIPEQPEIPDRYPIIEIEYAKNSNNVKYVNVKNIQGEVLFRQKFSRDDMGNVACVVDLEAPSEQDGLGTIWSTLNSENFGGPSMKIYDKHALDIVRYLLERDENGFVIRKTYHSDNANTITRDELGIYGYYFVLDSIGRCVRTINLGYDGRSKVPNNKNGVCEQSFEYDDFGNIVRNLFVDMYNQIRYGSHRKYDKYGNMTESTFIGKNNKPIIMRDYSMVACIYDEHGFLREVSYYDPLGRPCLKGGAHGTVQEIDKRGRLRRHCFYNENNELCKNQNGYAIMKAKYKNGNRIEEAYFDEYGKPCLHRKGYAKWTAKYKRGKMIEQSFYDADGHLCLVDGCAKWTKKYDDNGNLIECAYFGLDKEPCVVGGYWKKVCKYNDERHMIERAYYGIDGNLCLVDECARIVVEYAKDNAAEICCYGVDNKLCMAHGFARATSKYDRGNRIEELFFDTIGNPCLITDGYAKVTVKYDHGSVVERAFYDQENRLCNNVSGYAKQTIKYDEAGHVVEAAYFGADDKLCLNAGHAKWTAKYDRFGNRIELSYFDIDNKPCLKDGFAKCITDYDTLGNQVGITYFGVDNKLCLKDGYAKCITNYDALGNKTGMAYFGADNKLCMRDGYAKWTAKYDEEGNLIEMSYFGADNNPCINKDGYAKWEAKYDNFGNRIESSFLGINGESIDKKEILQRRYDRQAVEVFEMFFNQ